MNTPFSPGYCLASIEQLKDSEKKNIALAEYYYFSAQPAEAIQIAKRYITSSHPAYRLSASLIYAFASLSLNKIPEATIALSAIEDTLPTNAARDFIAFTASVLLHLPLPKEMPPVRIFLSSLPFGLRAFALYAEAHYLYLTGDYGKSAGLTEAALEMGAEQYPIPAIYLHLIAVMDYMSLKDTENAEKHLLSAWQTARQDNLIEAFGEHHGLLGGMLEAVIKPQWPDDFKHIIHVTYRFSEGWRKIHNPKTGHEVADDLTTTDLYEISLTVGERRNYLPSEEGISRMARFIFNDEGGSLVQMSLSAQTDTVDALRKGMITDIGSLIHMEQAVPDAANEEPEAIMLLSPDEVILNRGKEFEVTLSLKEEMDVWGILAGIDYDPEVLELLGYSVGNMFDEELYLVQEDIAKVPFRLLATRNDLSTEKTSGEFVKLHFKVRYDANDNPSTISIERLEVIGDKAGLTVNLDDAVQIAADDTAPVIKGIRDNETYTGDTEVEIEEDNLASITVNGIETTLQNNKFILSAMEGTQTVIAVDKAGNSTSVTVTFLPDPEEETDIPDKSDETDKPEGDESSVQDTGVNRHLALWFTLLILAGGCAYFIYRKQKQS